MALEDVIAAVERREKTLTVFNPRDEAIVDDVSAYFQYQNVEIETESTPSGRPTGFAVLARDGEFLAAVDVETLRELVDEVPTGSDGIGIDDTEYHQFLQHLKETTFTSYDKEQMLQASYEIEDRAGRRGAGTLYAGFQYPSLFKDQAKRYRQLADAGVEVTVFVSNGDGYPDRSGLTVTEVQSAEIESNWFVVYDGGGRDRDKCAIVAEERSQGSFYGFWSYDPGIVDRVVNHIRDKYDRVSP